MIKGEDEKLQQNCLRQTFNLNFDISSRNSPSEPSAPYKDQSEIYKDKKIR